MLGTAIKRERAPDAHVIKPLLSDVDIEGQQGSGTDRLKAAGGVKPGVLQNAWTAAFQAGCCGKTATLTAGTIYCITSGALTLLNKEVLAHYDFKAVHALLMVHCIMAVGFVQFARACGWATIEPLTKEVIKIWMPVNIIFVGMLATNFYALQTVGVGMVSILKNLSNLFILVGDYVFFRRTYSWHVWACLAIMFVSVVTGAATDISFSLEGYAWQMVNNCFTAAYALYLSRVTEKLTTGGAGGGAPGEKGRGVNQLSMVYYNNVLSIPLTFLLVMFTGEWRGLAASAAVHQRSFQVCAVMGGILGFVISFSSIWFVSISTATMYSLAGSLNKVLVAAAGIIMYNESREPRNIASIAVGLLAGSLLPFIKARQAKPAHSSGSGGAAGGDAARKQPTAPLPALRVVVAGGSKSQKPS